MRAVRMLWMIRGDSDERTEWTFRHGRLAEEVEQARFYVREYVDGPLLVRITLTDHPDQWTVEDETATARLRWEDTAGLPAGMWHYDVEFTFSDGRVTTPERGGFHLIGDIATDLAGDAIPETLFGVGPAAYCAIVNAPHASCENPFATINDFYANLSGLHALTQFRGTWQSESGAAGGVPGQVLITDVYIIRLTPWDDLVNFQLGREGDAAWLVDDHQHHLREAIPPGEDSAVRRVTVNKYVDQPVHFVATWDQGGATQGDAIILVDWRAIHFRSLYADISWGMGSGEFIIGSVPGHSLITGVWVVRREKWGWDQYSSNFQVGRAGNPDWLVSNSEHKLNEDVPEGEDAGVAHVTGNKRYVPDDTPIVITHSPGGPVDEGHGVVVVAYEPLLPGSW